MERIIISKHSVQENKNELVRLRKDAQRAVYRMQRESGLSASFIVSEIVRQAENFVEFTEDGDVQVC